MIKTRLALIVAFILAIAAGGSVGLVADRAFGRADRGSWLGRKLDLTAEQREQMRRVWSEAMRSARTDVFEQRIELGRERHEKIQQLLSEEQKARYDEIKREFEQRQKELDKMRKAIFQHAHERTREILTESQRAEFDRMFKRGPGTRHGPGPGFGPSRGGMGPRSPQRSR